MSSLEEELKKSYTKNLDENIKVIDNLFSNDIDVIKREFSFHEDKNIPAVCFYTDGLVNTQVIEDTIKTLTIYRERNSNSNEQDLSSSTESIEQIKKNIMINSSVQIINNFEKAINAVLVGDTIFLFEGFDQGFLIPSRGWDARSVDEPQTEQVVRGPRDGFTENIRTNTALLRRRIRDPLLRVEGMQIGKKSKTDINIVYLEGTVKEGLVEEVKERLKKIKIDAVLESGYIEELIKDSPRSPFTTTQNTERPDKVAAGIWKDE